MGPAVRLSRLILAVAAIPALSGCAALGLPDPEGDMPIWKRQSTNSRSGAETWRCVECHGWDYKGVSGAYAAGSHLTGFPGVLAAAAEMSEAELIDGWAMFHSLLCYWQTKNQHVPKWKD